MAKKAKELGPLAVSKLSAPGLHFVGGVSGLAPQVLLSGGRTWVLRATMGGGAEIWASADFPTSRWRMRARRLETLAN